MYECSTAFDAREHSEICHANSRVAVRAFGRSTPYTAPLVPIFEARLLLMALEPRETTKTCDASGNTRITKRKKSANKREGLGRESTSHERHPTS